MRKGKMRAITFNIGDQTFQKKGGSVRVGRAGLLEKLGQGWRRNKKVGKGSRKIGRWRMVPQHGADEIVYDFARDGWDSVILFFGVARLEVGNHLRSHLQGLWGSVTQRGDQWSPLFLFSVFSVLVSPPMGQMSFHDGTSRRMAQAYSEQSFYFCGNRFSAGLLFLS